jgi:peroxiredoxin
MKKISIYILTLFVLLHCFSSKGAQLIVNLKAPKEVKGSEYGLCISNYSIRNTYGDQFETIYKSKNGKFNITLDPGRYMIAMVYPCAEPLYYHIYLSEKSSTVEFNIELDRLCLNQKLDSVTLIGDHNGWSNNNRIRFKYNDSKKYWYVPNSEIPKNLTSFKFLLNGGQGCYLQNFPIDSLGTWVIPSNLYTKSKKDIIFNPADYKQGKPQPKISGTYDTIFNALAEKIQDLYINTYYKASDVSTKEGLENYKKQYAHAMDELYKIIDKTPNNIKWATINAQAEFYRLSTMGARFFASKTKNSKLQSSIYKSNEYIEQCRNIAKLYQNAEFNNLTLCTSDINELWNIESDLNSFALNDELNIPYGYFKQKLVDALKTIDNQNLCAEIIWNKASSLRYNNPEKAIVLYNQILEKYPNSNYSKKGTIKKMIVGLKVKEGALAPDFTVKTVSGNDITLSALKGKYVFIDFWGTWCAPCRQEIPNVKKLSETYPADKLVVMGIAQDNTEAVKKYIAENGIKYENAVPTPDVFDSYGVNSYPTTFLISPDGIILAKNLRGELVDQMKEFIK